MFEKFKKWVSKVIETKPLKEINNENFVSGEVIFKEEAIQKEPKIKQLKKNIKYRNVSKYR